jgi:hypothetical protein
MDSCRRRTSSTLLFDAPSISRTSMSLPAAMDRQMSQVRHGDAVGPVSQLRALARIRAIVVLPTPRTPVKRKACATRSCSMAFERVRVTASWPTRSAKVCGRYFRARTV